MTPTTRLCALLRLLDSRRRVREFMYARRVPVMRAQLNAMRGGYQ